MKGKKQKMEKLRELLKARDALMAESKEKPPESLEERQSEIASPILQAEKTESNARPKSLEGLSVHDLFLLETDTEMTPEERRWWFPRRQEYIYRQREDFFLMKVKDSWLR